MWILNCRDCGASFDENEQLPMKANPSDIMQSVCNKCYGVLDLMHCDDEAKELEPTDTEC